MSWIHFGSAALGTDFTDHTSYTLALGSSVNPGHVMLVGVTADNTNPTSFALSDSLGNTYTQIFNDNSFGGTGNQFCALFVSFVTHAGAPTLTVQFNPTPGTTLGRDVGIVYDAFSGSDGSSATDGAGGDNDQNPVGAGTDAVTSGSWSTTHDGDLIYAVTTDYDNNVTPGTGFSAGSTASGIAGSPGFSHISEWKVQTTHGSVAATFTNGTSQSFITLALAITPAVVVNFASDEGEVWLDVWKAAKPYVPIVTVYN